MRHTIIVISLGWMACCLWASLAVGQPKSELFNFEQLMQEARGRGAGEIEEYRRKLAAPEGADVERLLAELTATPEAEAKQIVFSYLQGALRQRSIPRDEFDALRTALTYLGERYRQFDRDQGIIQFLTQYADDVARAEIAVPGYLDNPRRDLMAAVMYGLAKASQMQAVQQLAQRYPDIIGRDVVETAMPRIEPLPPVPLPRPELPSTESPSPELPRATPQPTEAPVPDRMRGDHLPVGGAPPRPQTVAFQPWQWSEDRGRFETELRLAGRPVLTAVFEPDSTSDQQKLARVWHPASGVQFAYDFASRRYVDPKTNVPLDPTPHVGAGSGRQPLMLPDLPLLPGRSSGTERPAVGPETPHHEAPTARTDQPASARFAAWHWNPTAKRYETELRLGERTVATAVHDPASAATQKRLGWVWLPASDNWFAFDFDSGAYLDRQTLTTLDQTPRVRAGGGQPDQGLKLPKLPQLPQSQ